MSQPERADIVVSTSRRTTAFLRVATAAWAVAAISALGVLGARAARPGDAGAPPSRWPASSGLPRAVDRPTLVLFLDAHCPCGAASLAELGRLLARAAGPVDAVVVVSGPAGELAAVAGARIVHDPRGEEARRFGVVTSGHALLFDREGALVFGGGITATRGHEGDNLGAEAVVDRLGGRPAPAGAPVFGCPIEEAP